jgi:DNA-binding MarR family transcriptional regulator
MIFKVLATASIPTVGPYHSSVPGGTQWLSDPEQKAWRALVGATSALMATLDAELQAAHDMTLGEYEVLVALSEAEDRRLRMSDLAALLHLSPSGLTRRLDTLARRNWVARERCPSDRRGTFAVLTEEGLTQLEEAAPTHVQGVRAHLVDRLSARQLANLAGALGGIAADWPAHAATACDNAHEDRAPASRAVSGAASPARARR